MGGGQSWARAPECGTASSGVGSDLDEKWFDWRSSFRRGHFRGHGAGRQDRLGTLRICSDRFGVASNFPALLSSMSFMPATPLFPSNLSPRSAFLDDSATSGRHGSSFQLRWSGPRWGARRHLIDI